MPSRHDGSRAAGDLRTTITSRITLRLRSPTEPNCLPAHNKPWSHNCQFLVRTSKCQTSVTETHRASRTCHILQYRITIRDRVPGYYPYFCPSVDCYANRVASGPCEPVVVRLGATVQADYRKVWRGRRVGSHLPEDARAVDGLIRPKRPLHSRARRDVTRLEYVDLNVARGVERRASGRPRRPRALA